MNPYIFFFLNNDLFFFRKSISLDPVSVICVLIHLFVWGEATDERAQPKAQDQSHGQSDSSIS